MTKKEQQPENSGEEQKKFPKDLPYDPEINKEDKETLNNQSEDENKGDYFKERQEPIDYAGADLDLPDMDNDTFNPTTNQPEEVEKERKPKESVNSDDNLEPDTRTVYKGKKAEKYQDPSKKKRDQKKGSSDL